VRDCLHSFRIRSYSLPRMMVEIPFQQLTNDALQGVIDDFILREGTDYGTQEASLEKKREDILRQLKNGKAKIVFEPETESITLLPVPR
jgi:uncharacterized protein